MKWDGRFLSISYQEKRQAFQESLECKYKTKDDGTKEFLVAWFLDYNMVDSKNVISQVQNLQVFPHDIHAEGMILSETFQVAAIIEKLPPSWKDTFTPDSAKANMVEHAGSSSRSNSKGKDKGKKKNDKKSKVKSEYIAPKAGIVKQKFQGTCYNCEQQGHRATNCKMSKWVNPRQENMVTDDMDMIAMVSDISAIISEVNLVEKLIMDRSCRWATLLLLISRANEMLF
nr:hypothetical protein [Tanacetum cinerariifolium]